MADVPGAGGKSSSTAAARLQKNVIVWSISAGALTSLVYAIQARDWAQFFSVVAVAVIISGAALFAGALIGFLFGIPRAFQHDNVQGDTLAVDAQSQNGSRPQAGYQANTNLEQISDWLTKILVGVGLTQIGSIPGAIGSYASSTSAALGGFAGSTVFSVGLLLYYLVVGFVIGYLLTRLYLPGAFHQADLLSIGSKVGQLADKVGELEKQAEIDARVLGLVRRQFEPGQAAPPTQDELNEGIAQASAPVKAQIFYDARALRRDTSKADGTKEKEKMERTIPVFRALIASDQDNEYHQNYAQLGFALKDKLEPDLNGAVDALTTAIEIRGGGTPAYRLYEWNRALCRLGLDAAGGEAPSDEETKATIAADLAAARTIALEWMKDEPVKTWLEVNRLTPDTLDAEAPAAEVSGDGAQQPTKPG